MRYSILWSFNIQNLFQRNGQGNHILFTKVTRELLDLVKVNSHLKWCFLWQDNSSLYLHDETQQ